MRSFEKTGLISHTNRYKGHYGEAVEFLDYHTSMNHVLAAQEAFQSLPSKIRQRFQNDPGQFLDFVQSEENREEAISLGLLPAVDGAGGGSLVTAPPNPVETLTPPDEAPTPPEGA